MTLEVLECLMPEFTAGLTNLYTLANNSSIVHK